MFILRTDLNQQIFLGEIFNSLKLDQVATACVIFTAY
jgi:hypothetical protein